MMLDVKAAFLWLAGIGMLISFLLWAFRLVPWWAILVGGMGMPIVAVVALVLFGLLAWMARGSH